MAGSDNLPIGGWFRTAIFFSLWVAGGVELRFRTNRIRIAVQILQIPHYIIFYRLILYIYTYLRLGMYTNNSVPPWLNNHKCSSRQRASDSTEAFLWSYRGSGWNYNVCPDHSTSHFVFRAFNKSTPFAIISNLEPGGEMICTRNTLAAQKSEIAPLFDMEKWWDLLPHVRK